MEIGGDVVHGPLNLPGGIAHLAAPRLRPIPDRESCVHLISEYMGGRGYALA